MRSPSKVDRDACKVSRGAKLASLVRLQIAVVIALVGMMSYGYGAVQASVGGPEGTDEEIINSAKLQPARAEEEAQLGAEKLFIPAVNTDGAAFSAESEDTLAAEVSNTGVCYSQDLAMDVDAGPSVVPFARIRRPSESTYQTRLAYYFELKDSAQNVVGRSFCIQPFADLELPEPSYCTGDASALTGELAWLLANYPPIDRITQPTLAPHTAPGCVTAGSLHCTELVQNVARQLAIWSRTVDQTIVRTDNPTSLAATTDTAILEVYDAIVATIPSQLSAEYTVGGEVALVITPESATNTLPGGEEHLFTVKVTKGGVAIAGKEVTVSTDFGTLNQSVATTDVNGEATFTVSSNSAGTANLTASVLVPALTKYVHPTKPSSQQTASGGMTSLSASAQKTWEVAPICSVNLAKSCLVETLPPPPTGNLACTSAVAATTLRYTGSGITNAKVEIFLHKDNAATAVYDSVNLVSNVTVLTAPAQNGWTIDGRSTKTKALNPKITVKITNKATSQVYTEVIHTSCSQPYVAGQPAPLDGSGGASPTWLVISFANKDGGAVVSEPIAPALPALSNLCEVTSSGPGWPGVKVTYQYDVTNNGDPLSGVSVVDDKLGLIAGPFDLPNGASETFAAQSQIFETTENLANLQGTLANGSICVAEASAEVIVNVPPPPPGGGGIQGCTPGYWKQSHHFDSWVGYTPNQYFDSVFGVGPHVTLVQALGTGGGGAKALGRHAVAALLDASNPGVDYAFTVQQVISLVQSAYSSGNFETSKDLLEKENERGCPLN